MKHKSGVGQAGLLLLLMLRQAHTRRLPVGRWQKHSWNKTIIHVHPKHAAGAPSNLQNAR